MSPASYSSPSLVASVAASPSPVTSNNSTFRSLRSLLPFGPAKNSNSNANSSSDSSHSTPKGAFSGFSSMRKSLTRDRERDRKNSLTNLLPVISIDRSSVNQSFGEGYTRRAASYSHLEQQVTPQNQPRQILGEFGTLERHSISEVAAPLLRSISPGPPLTADLSTIIEGDSSCISKGDPLSSKPPTPSTGSPLLPSPHIAESIEGSETASLDLNSNQIAKEVYAAIAGENATEQWLAAEQPIVIDADTDDDMPFPPPPSSSYSPGVNIENVDPSIVALLSPNNLPKRSPNANMVKKPQQPLGSSMLGSSPSQPNSFSSNSPLNGGSQHRRVPTTSSIPRLRPPLTEPTTPGSTSALSAETTFKAPSSSVTPVSNMMQRIKPDVARQRRIASHSPMSTPETRITVNTNFPPAAGAGAATAIASPRSLARIFSHPPSIPQPLSPSSPSSPSSAPPTPPVPPRIPTLANRLQAHSSSDTHLKQSVPRTPSPTIHTPQLISTQASTSSVSTIPTAPHTPSTSGTSNAPHTPGSPHTPNSVTRTAQSMTRPGSESSSVFQRRLHSRDGFDEMVTTPMVGPDHRFGRTSLDSRKPAQQQRKFQLSARVGGGSGGSDAHVLATSTPFRRSEDGIGVRRTQNSETPASSPIIAHETTEMEVTEGGESTSLSLRSRKEGDGYHSATPSPPKFSGMLRPPFRSRKRSMSVQENPGVLQSLLGGRGGGKTEKVEQGERMESVLLHHDASRSNTSLSGRLAGLKMKEDAREEMTREDGDQSPVQRPPVHDWLGPRSVKALRAAGLLVDRDRGRDDPQLGRSSRERSGTVATSVITGGSGKTSLGAVGRLFHSRSGGPEYGPQHGPPYQLQHHHSQGHGHYGLGHGRAPSRMAFSDAGGPTSVTSSRRGSGTFSHLMHSPTLTTSTSGSRDRDRERDRDMPRSVTSTAPTSVSSASLACLRERDEIRELKDKHATETGALLGALSDSQRTTRILREENHDLRERLERFADAEAENEDLRREVRSLKREVNELKVQLLTGGSRGPSRMNSSGPATENGRSGLNTPVPHGSSSHEVSPQKLDMLRPPSWGRQTSAVSSATTSLRRSPTPESVPDAPRHRRCPSDASSIFPVLPSNMSLLMHEEQELSNQTDENEQQGLSSAGTSLHDERTLDQLSPPHHAQSQAQTVAATAAVGIPTTRPRPLSLRKMTGPNGITPASSRSRTSATSISPTTANFSMVTGSPGSLFLRPEHEVHLGDLETFSLDFGRAEMEDVVGIVGGVDDW